jgi:hypothetical protein
MAKRSQYSRLSRRQEKENIRRAFIYISLALVLLGTTVLLGIPILVKVAVFFAEIKGSSLPVEQTDLLAPPPPRINLLPEATKTAYINLSGTAEAGATVEIYINDKKIDSIVSDSDSKFSTGKLRLEEGRNSIYAIALDSSGNQSSTSEKHYIWYDEEPPELEITSPQDGASFYGEQEKSIEVQGKTESGVTVLVNDRMVIVNSEGGFSTTFSLNEGENLIKVVAQDEASNETEQEIKVIYFP